MDSIVTFGKFKGKTIRHMLQDQKYIDWVKTNPELCAKLHAQFDLNIFDYSAPHNVLQMKFLSPTFVQQYLRLTANIFSAKPNELLRTRLSQMMQRMEWCFGEMEWTLPCITEEFDTSVHFEHHLGWDLTVRECGVMTVKSEETIESFMSPPSCEMMHHITRKVKSSLLESNRWGWKPEKLDWFVDTDFGDIDKLKYIQEKCERFRGFLNSFQPVETMIPVLNWKHVEVKALVEKEIKSMLETVFQYEHDVLKINRVIVSFEGLHQIECTILYEVDMSVMISEESNLHFVEIVSTMAEDYPRLLQELKLRREQVSDSRAKFVVMVDQIQAVSVTRKEIQEMFAIEGFQMIFFDEIDDDIDMIDRRIESLSVDLQNLKKRRKLAKTHTSK